MVRWDHVPILEPFQVPVRHESLHVQIEAETGRVLNYYKSQWSLANQLDLRITPGHALTLAREVARRYVPDREFPFARESLQFVRPNMYWGSEEPFARTDQASAAWIVLLSALDNQEAEFWIDAATGVCLGGDQTRK